MRHEKKIIEFYGRALDVIEKKRPFNHFEIEFPSRRYSGTRRFSPQKKKKLNESSSADRKAWFSRAQQRIIQSSSLPFFLFGKWPCFRCEKDYFWGGRMIIRIRFLDFLIPISVWGIRLLQVLKNIRTGFSFYCIWTFLAIGIDSTPNHSINGYLWTHWYKRQTRGAFPKCLHSEFFFFLGFKGRGRQIESFGFWSLLGVIFYSAVFFRLLAILRSHEMIIIEKVSKVDGFTSESMLFPNLHVDSELWVAILIPDRHSRPDNYNIP